MEPGVSQRSAKAGARQKLLTAALALIRTAAHHWSEITGVLFDTARYHLHSDPLDRVLGYLDFRKALHTQAVLQGAFVMAKAKGGAPIAAASIDHLHRYIELLFKPSMRKKKVTS